MSALALSSNWSLPHSRAKARDAFVEFLLLHIISIG
jgi:hypothetical protein